MAISRATAALVKPLEGAIVRRYTLGATTVAGEIVSMQSDGKVDPADTTAAAQRVVGIALQGGADTEVADVVVHGPVLAVAGGTPGSTLHATDTAGEPGESAGTNPGIAGFVEAATIVFIRPTH